MKSVQLSELGLLAEKIREGAPLEVRDGERLIARIVPSRSQTIEERIDELAAQGKVKKGTGTLPDWFFTDPLPKLEGGSALEQLLADRRKNDW